MEKSKLDEIGVRRRTDKSSLLHNYLVEYEKFFNEPDKVDTVVEIGLQRGSKDWRTNDVSPSVEMWLEFFPNSHVYGFDKKNLKFNNSRVTFMRGDQGVLDDVVHFYGLIDDADLILDDGSHQSDHQLVTFMALWPKVKSGGLYIIEDLNPVVQRNNPDHLRIRNMISLMTIKDISSFDYIGSDNSGPKSSLIIRKN